MFVDLHVHSILSDGVLLPSELIRRAEAKGLRGIAIADHVDESNLSRTIEALLQLSSDLERGDFAFLVGVEITHVHPERIGRLTEEARSLGADLVIVHGETIVEPVREGTNLAAIEAGVDILAHPGLISLEEASMARERGVYLEVSGRKGHSFCNGHVVKTASMAGARLVFNTDSHTPSDLFTEEEALRVLEGSGLSREGAEEVLKNNLCIIEKLRREG